jgi:hypothetical protein
MRLIYNPTEKKKYEAKFSKQPNIERWNRKKIIKRRKRLSCWTVKWKKIKKKFLKKHKTLIQIFYRCRNPRLIFVASRSTYQNIILVYPPSYLL